jgi:hypothetical protein
MRSFIQLESNLNQSDAWVSLGSHLAGSHYRKLSEGKQGAERNKSIGYDTLFADSSCNLKVNQSLVGASKIQTSRERLTPLRHHEQASPRPLRIHRETTHPFLLDKAMEVATVQPIHQTMSSPWSTVYPSNSGGHRDPGLNVQFGSCRTTQAAAVFG